MSPGIIDIIINKLERLEEYLKILSDLRKYPVTQFINDYRVHGLAERYLQLSIEIILDVGKLVCIESKFETPENNHEIFEILQKHKVLSKTLYTRLRGIAGFRNILVHDYMKINHKIVYNNLQNINDFKLYVKAINKRLRI